MGQPGGAARDGKDRRESVARQPDGVEQKTRVHLDIGLDAAAGLAALQRRDRAAFDVDDKAEPGGVGIKALERRAQEIRAGIAMTEDAMTEAHEASAGREFLVDPAVHIAARLDLVEHIEREPRRAAVQRAAKRAIAAQRRGGERGAR